MFYSVDRIEGEFAAAIADSGEKKDIPLSLLSGVKEGDVIEYKDGVYIIRDDLTLQRRKRNAKRYRSMFE